MFDLEKEIIVETNTLDYAIRVCLLQLGKDKALHLIAFYLRKITLLKLNYDIYDKELLAIVKAFRE